MCWYGFELRQQIYTDVKYQLSKPTYKELGDRLKLSFKSKTVVKLTQEQSKLLDNLPWGPLKVKEKEGKFGTYTVKFSLCSFDKAPVEVSKLFAELNIGRFETLRSFSGLYDYSMGDDVFFQKPVKGISSWTQEQKDQRKEDLAGLESKPSFSDGAKKGHEENVQMHQEYMQSHKERMEAYNEWKTINEQDKFLQREYTDAVNLNTQVLKDVLTELREANRLKQKELEETQK
jgi:hypothetical protein